MISWKNIQRSEHGKQCDKKVKRFYERSGSTEASGVKNNAAEKMCAQRTPLRRDNRLWLRNAPVSIQDVHMLCLFITIRTADDGSSVTL